MFRANNGTKNNKYNKDIHKPMRILDDIFKTNNKLFVTVYSKNTCKVESADHLWLPFIDQPQ